MIRFSAILFVCLACGCGPTVPAAIEARQLVVAYRDSTSEPQYTGRAIRVNLPPKSYSVTPAIIGWSTGLPESPPVIVFLCDRPPADNSRAIEVTGVCRGKVQDGVHRGYGVSWFLKVDGCRWEAR